MQSTPESGGRAGYDGYKRKKGSKVHMAVETLGHLLTLHVTPADVADRERVAALCQAVQVGGMWSGPYPRLRRGRLRAVPPRPH